MNSEVKKILLLVFGAVFMLVLGAWGMWVTTKINQSSTLPASIPTPPPIPGQPTQISNTTQQQSEEIKQAEETKLKQVEESKPAESAEHTPPPTPNFALAKIVNVEPRYIVRAIPYRRCHYVCHLVYPYQSGTSGAGALIGGVAGGLAGNQIGAGNGRIAATIGGSILGALVGNQVEESANEPHPYQVCNTICHIYYDRHTERDGYRVTYSYNGQQKSLIMKEAPTSDTIPLSLTPLK